MRELTKEQVRARLAAPNGSQTLVWTKREAAFDAAWGAIYRGRQCSGLRVPLPLRKAEGICGAHRCAAGPGTIRAACGAFFLMRPSCAKTPARLAGALADTRDVPALIAALGRESQRFVRPSMLLALGACGGEAAQAALASYVVAPAANAAEEGHAREEAEGPCGLRAKRSCSSKSMRLPGLREAYTMVLHTPDKLEGSLLQELAQQGVAPVSVESGAVSVQAKELAPLFACRSFFELLFPIARKSSAAPELIARRAGAFLGRPLLPASHAGEGPVRLPHRSAGEKG